MTDIVPVPVALRLIWDAARTPGVFVPDAQAVSERLFRCRLDIRLPDGDLSYYNLEVTADGDGEEERVTVREAGPDRRLPSACPERHINGDGSFCVAYEEDEVRRPSTFESAVEWWKKLRGFLWLQEKAAATRRWPQELAWAHGDAAKYQKEFEHVSDGANERVVKAVRDEKVTVEGDGRPLRRRPCPCGSGKKIKNCSHERVLAELCRLWTRWKKAETEFWAACSGQECCGTMDDCYLRRVGRKD